MELNKHLFNGTYQLIKYYLIIESNFLSGKKLANLIQKESGLNVDFKDVSYQVKLHQKNGIFEIINVSGKGYIYIAIANEEQAKLINKQIEVKKEHAKLELFIFNRLSIELNKSIKLIGANDE